MLDQCTFQTASTYATMNGDKKLWSMRRKLRLLSSLEEVDLEHGICCDAFDVGSLANSGEDHLLLYSGNLKEIMQREVDRLEAIETAREGLGKKCLWPRWGNPRRRGAGKRGCLKEVTHVVLKQGGRDDVSYTCLERRTFPVDHPLRQL